MTALPKPTPIPATRGQTILDQRFIAAPARRGGWIESGAGWLYPICDPFTDRAYRVALDAQPAYPAAPEGYTAAKEGGYPVLRWKAFDSHAAPKYLWYPGGVVERPRYYCLPDLKRRIAAGGLAVYIASGEPDVLAYEAAGLPALSVGFGEGQISSSLVADLTRLGAKMVVFAPDLDRAGAAWGSRLISILKDGDFFVDARTLPDSLGEKGDVNKLLISVNGDAQAFQAALDAAPAFLPNDAPPVLKTIPFPPGAASETAIPTAYFDDIARALGVVGYKGDGWSQSIKCVLSDHQHDDKTPAAGWHRDWHVYHCFKCHSENENVLAKDIAPKLGINLKDYLAPKTPAPPRASAPPKTPPPTNMPAAAPGAGPPRVVGWGDAAARARAYLTGDFGGGMALPQPYSALARLGGLSSLLLRRKTLAVVADTGGGKTSFVESMVDYWRERGISGLWWGAEWSPEEYILRALQRLGGADVISLIKHNDYEKAARLGLPPDQRPYAPLPVHVLARTQQLLDKIASWDSAGGSLLFLDQLSLGADTLIASAKEGMRMLKEAGKECSFVVFDYVQLIKGTAGDHAVMKDALADLKGFCVDNDLHGVFTSQINKLASQEARKDGGGLHLDAMNNMRADSFNTVITLTPRMENGEPKRVLMPEGRHARVINARVTKDSLRGGASADLHHDGERLRFLY